LNNMLVRELLANPAAWEEVTYTESQGPIAYSQPLELAGSQVELAQTA